MQIRRFVVATVAAVGILVPALSATTAVAAPGGSAKVTAKAKPAKPAKPPMPGKAAKPGKGAKPVNFVATGVLTAVDVAAGTVTVTVKGGTVDVRGRIVTFAVTAKTRVSLNDTVVTLAELTAGNRVSVHGTRVGTGYTVVKVNATAPVASPEPTEPVDEPTEPVTGPTEPVVEPTA